ncbi:MAG: xylulokinase [Opitutales bacterium]|nr:xylulokinase [Opitutales bacterium]
MSSYLLGIDIATTSTKTLLMEGSGKVLGSATAEYPLETPKPLWSEQDPEHWWEATVKTIREVLQKTGVSASSIAGIGLSGQMHGLVCLDSDNRVLRPAILWNDQRTGAQCDAITQRVGAEKVIQLTGNPILTGFTAPKLLWVQENEPDVYSRIAKILLPKDYVRYRLTNSFCTDVSDASGMSLLDVANRRWSDEMVDAVGAKRAWLADVSESSDPSSKVTGEGASATGLPEGIPVVGGGGDQACQAVGVGIVREGVASATLGTSGVVFAASDEYRVEPEGRLHAFCHAVPGKWHLMGVMLSAAGSFRWYKDVLGQQESREAAETGKDPFEILTQQAALAPAGCEGLLFLPYLTGERTPWPDPLARGNFFGLTLRHQKAHMTRSVMEGVTYGMRDSLELMRNLQLKVSHIVASGGGAKSPLWRQMMADNFHARTVTVNASEGAAYGACLLAATGAGIFPSVEAACDACLQETGETLPGPEATVYDDFYPHYKSLYPALAPIFHKVAATVEKHGGSG